jgi:polyhydroxybutyrate depolymerase
MSRLAIAMLVAVPAACGSGGGGNDALPGKHTHPLEVDGMPREVIVYVPPSVVPSPPAVLMFHGTSGDGEKFYDISGWREQADAEGLIAVFPSALVSCHKEDENDDGDFTDPMEAAVTTKWMAWDWATTTKFQQCTPAEIAMLPADKRAAADHPYADDVAYVEAVLELLATEYDVDDKRLYATGFSNGGSFTARLALERSERFAAVASNSGMLGLPPAPQARPLTYVVSIGATDPKILAKLGLTEIPIRASTLTDVPELATTIEAARTMLQVTSDAAYAEQAIGGKQVGTFTFATSTASASNQLQFRIIADLEHQYPNGKNHPVVMADELWAVFETQRLP